MQRSEVKRALHVDPKAKWEECNMEVHSKFNSDWWISQKKSVEMVLKEIPVLFYNGNNDFICNFVGTDRWSVPNGLCFPCCELDCFDGWGDCMDEDLLP